MPLCPSLGDGNNGRSGGGERHGRRRQSRQSRPGVIVNDEIDGLLARRERGGEPPLSSSAVVGIAPLQQRGGVVWAEAALGLLPPAEEEGGAPPPNVLLLLLLGRGRVDHAPSRRVGGGAPSPGRWGCAPRGIALATSPGGVHQWKFMDPLVPDYKQNYGTVP